MTKSVNFEKSLEELELIVNQLEQGELSLDQSLKLFEKGVKLTRSCQQSLTTAEQRIKTLSQEIQDNS